MVVKCLTVANQKGHNSISFPCLGTGYNGYPHIEVAALMFEAVTEYDKTVSSTNVQKVNFVALSSDRKSMGVGMILMHKGNRQLPVLENCFLCLYQMIMLMPSIRYYIDM